IVALGDSLHLKTVAEGIETKAQLRHLQRLRCELGQGYYFASPQPAEEVTRFLSTDFDATSNGHSSASRARAAAT
nr:EAL domain-containing protein [Actinomycetota bacterium]